VDLLWRMSDYLAQALRDACQKTLFRPPEPLATALNQVRDKVANFMGIFEGLYFGPDGMDELSDDDEKDGEDEIEDFNTDVQD